MLDDYQSAPIDDRLRSALRLLELIAKRPWELTTAALEPLREAGLDDLAIEDVLGVGSLFAMFVRVADAFDFAAPTKRERKLLARVLRSGYEKRDALSPELPRHRAGLEALVEASHDAAGPTDKSLRQTIAEWVDGSVRGQEPAPDNLPAPLRTIVDKEVRHAYKITDADFGELAEAGFADEAIYDIVIVVAVAAGAARYQLGLAALSPTAVAVAPSD